MIIIWINGCKCQLFCLLLCYLLDGLIGLLESRRGQESAYVGCMKSGEVITEE